MDFTSALAYASLGNFGGAIRGFRKSLFCVFTSNGAFRDIQKVWSHMLAAPGGQTNATLHAEIGEVSWSSRYLVSWSVGQ